MDTTSFLALFKATCVIFPNTDIRLHSPPAVIMGTLVYLLGLGYDVELSGNAAEEYIGGSCGATSPGTGVQEGGETRASLAPAHPVEHASAIDWSSMQPDVYTFVMGAKHSYADGGVQGGYVRLIDQLHVRLHVIHAFTGENEVLVHCSRHIFKYHDDDMGYLELRGDAFAQVLGVLLEGQNTTCTVAKSSDGIFTIPANRFMDASFENFHGLKNIDELLLLLAHGLCKGSSRCSGASSATRQGIAQNVSSPPANQSNEYEDSYASRPRDTRVGYADMSPVDRRGAGQGLGPGGMMVGPHHPIFGRGRLEPPEGHEGNIPPGARWDPIGPPGTQGFFPGDFQRRNQSGVSRGSVHPDIMQPGRSASSDWM